MMWNVLLVPRYHYAVILLSGILLWYSTCSIQGKVQCSMCAEVYSRCSVAEIAYSSYMNSLL